MSIRPSQTPHNDTVSYLWGKKTCHQYLFLMVIFLHFLWRLAKTTRVTANKGRSGILIYWHSRLHKGCISSSSPLPTTTRHKYEPYSSRNAAIYIKSDSIVRQTNKVHLLSRSSYLVWRTTSITCLVAVHWERVWSMIRNSVDSCFLWGLRTVLSQNDWKN